MVDGTDYIIKCWAGEYFPMGAGLSIEVDGEKFCEGATNLRSAPITH